jgi:hypothetical protein
MNELNELYALWILQNLQISYTNKQLHKWRDVLR